MLSLLSSVQEKVEVPGQSHVPHPSQGSCQPNVPRPASVQQEMSRSFPALFKRHQKYGKRRFPSPFKMVSKESVKTINIQFYLLPKPMSRTPQGSQELSLLMAGLGKRQIALPENSNHAEISDTLQHEFPKLEALSGGWLFYK